VYANIGLVWFVQGLEDSLLAMATTSLRSTTPHMGMQLAATLLNDPPREGKAAGQTQLPPLGQAVLQLLFGSVGVADPATTDRALDLLERAATISSSALLQHHSVLLSVLDQVDQLSTQQVRSVFRIFGKVLVVESAPDEELLAEASYPVTAAVQLYLATALSRTELLSKRAGIIGMLQWQLALALAGPEKAEVAKNKLEALLGLVSRHTEMLAFLCQELSLMFLDLLQQPGAINAVRFCPS
jgi:hypothetical protein